MSDERTVKLPGFQWALVLESLSHDSRADALRNAIQAQLERPAGVPDEEAH